VRFFSSLIFLLCSLVVAGQDLKVDTIKNHRYRSILKWSPFHLASIYATVQLAYELQYRTNQSIQVDVGYVLNLDDELLYEDKRGVKLKTEWRYYLESNRESRSRYLSLEPYTNLINFDRTESNTECFDVECQTLFSRQYFYKVRYRETGITFKLGLQKQLNRFFLDLNYGLMLRDVHYEKPSIPPGFNEPVDLRLIFYPNEKRRTALGPTVGVRLGYRLSKD
jgi:hypothetical protein